MIVQPSGRRYPAILAHILTALTGCHGNDAIDCGDFVRGLKTHAINNPNDKFMTLAIVISKPFHPKEFKQNL